MKKGIILIISVITLILTFVFGELFSLYHFGDIPTLLTSFYLISIFGVFEYILLTIIYIIIKMLNKEKMSAREILGRILLFIALMFILLFIIILDVDWLNWYAYSSPFYINVIVRILQFIFPSILFIIVGTILIKKKQ